MKSRNLARFDWIILKPIWVIFIGVSLYYFFRKEWLLGLFFIVMNFLLGIVAQGIHKTYTLKELVDGNPNHEFAFSGNNTELSHNESHIITKALFKVAFIIGISAATISANLGVRYIYSFLVGIIFSMVMFYILLAVFMLTYKINR